MKKNIIILNLVKVNHAYYADELGTRWMTIKPSNTTYYEEELITMAAFQLPDNVTVEKTRYGKNTIFLLNGKDVLDLTTDENMRPQLQGTIPSPLKLKRLNNTELESIDKN